jgi:hypothetical protein
MVFKHAHNNILAKIFISFLVLFFAFMPSLLSITHAATTPPAADKTADGNKSGQAAANTSAWYDGPVSMIGSTLLSLSAWVTYFGGMVLQTSMQKLIYEMGSLVHEKSPLGDVINGLWKTIRDICNLAFIFGFIYIGIRTILDNESSNTKRMLAQIIIAALLINFSLFFTKIIIDFSNILAISIKNSMATGAGTISETIANTLGVSTIWNAPAGKLLAGMTSAGNISFYIMGSLLLLVAGFVLAAGGILIIIRFVMLVFIMIFSPILFGATIFPQTQQYASDLWKKLISYSFFAPAYLFMLLLSIHVLKAVTGMLNPKGEALSAGLSRFDAYDVILLFIVSIMFLIASLQVAQKFSVAGADKALSIGKDLRMRGQQYLGNTVGAATAGAAAATGRAWIGGAANYISNTDGLKNAASKRTLTGFAARQALKASRVTADASFDARNVAGLGKELGIGEGRKGGYKTVKEEVKKKEDEFARSLGEVDDTDVDVMARKKEWNAAEKKQKADTVRLREDLKKENNTPEEKERIQSQIDKLEKDTKDAQIKYEKEKQRRIIGSTYAKPKDPTAAEGVAEDVTKKKGALNEAWDKYKKLPTETEKEEARKDIKKQMEALAEKEKEHAVMMRENDGGYAGVLEKRSKWFPFATWLEGRGVIQTHDAGEAIRKTAEKGLPKKKDD